MARVFCREAAHKVVQEGLRLVVGAGGIADKDVESVTLGQILVAVHRSQKGLFSDLDYIADVLFDRV